ncbi:MAG: hypothetical protein QW341_00705 [Candidatus Bathyarchaeia archaeon]
MSITPELYDFVVKVVEDKVRDIRVTREEFDRLRKDMDEHFRRLGDAVAGLAEAQKRTEEELKILAEAQRRTEERLNTLAEAQKRTEEELKALAEAQRMIEVRLNALAEAQKRTEERVKALAEAQYRTEERLSALAEAQKRTEERLDALAEAQKMTEERLSALAEAQKRTEERLNALAEAQRRTEEAIMRLTVSLDALRVEVGRLSETVGFGLEDIARAVLPGWIYARLGVRVGDLRREFIDVDGREVEVNLYGEGELKGEKVIVVGEVKSRIYGSDVKEFYDNIYVPIARMAGTKVIGILFGYLIHPSAKKISEELGLYVVASYE